MKKFCFIVIMLLIVTSLWAYQGKRGIGLLMEFQGSTLTSTGDSTLNINPKLFYTFMLNNKLEIAPYLGMDLFKEELGPVTTDGYKYYGLGAMLNWHFIRTQIITLAAGFDFSYWFGELEQSVYGDNTYFRINSFIPLIFDLNLGKHIVIRIRQDIWYLSSYTIKDSSDRFTDTDFGTFSNLNPEFGVIILF